MKIIDLLNKIAKGEEVPKRIKVNDEEFNIYVISPITDYQDINQKSTYLFQDYIFSWGSVLFDDEVEILEVEDKEYEDIEELKNTINYYINYEDERLNEDIGHICRHLISHIDIINQIIRNQQKIIKQLENK